MNISIFLRSLVYFMIYSAALAITLFVNVHSVVDESESAMAFDTEMPFPDDLAEYSLGRNPIKTTQISCIQP